MLFSEYYLVIDLMINLQITFLKYNKLDFFLLVLEGKLELLNSNLKKDK